MRPKLVTYPTLCRNGWEKASHVKQLELEDQARKIALEVPGVMDLGECLVRRLGSSFLIGLTVVVEASLSVRAAHAVVQRVQDSIRKVNSSVRHVFIQVEPND